MPLVQQIDSLQTAQGTPTPSQQVGSSPNAFGAGVWEAAGNEANKYNEIQNQLRASDADLAFTQQAEPLMAEYLASQGRNTVEGQKDIMNKLGDMRKSFLENTHNTQEQEILASNMNYRLGSYGRQIASHAATQMKTWQNDTISGQVQNTINMGVDDYLVPEKVSENVNRLNGLVAQQGNLMGLPDETIKVNQSKVTSEYAGTMIRQAADTSPEAARTIYKAYAPLMDAPHRAEMTTWLDNREYTNLMRTYQISSHEASAAGRIHKDTQTQTYADLTGAALKGQPIDEGKINNMITSQQLTPSQGRAILKTAASKISGEPDQPVKIIDHGSYVDLNNGIMSGKYGADEIASMQNAGTINNTQAAIASQTLSKITSKPPTSEQSNLYNALIKQTVLDTTKLSSLPDQRKQADKQLGEIQSEWNQRVYINNESPRSVYHDLLDKHHFEPVLPNSWPKPMMGVPQSKDDLARIYSDTKSMVSIGKMSQTVFQQQAGIIKMYLDYYNAMPLAIPKVASKTFRKDMSDYNSQKTKLEQGQ